MLPFLFVEKFPLYDTSEVFVVRLNSSIELTDEFLKSLYYSLWFPGYFGFNWNALYDCLCDLSWIPCNKVVFLHDALPKVPEHDLQVYLDILKDAVLGWTNDDSHELVAVFQASEQATVEKLLI